METKNLFLIEIAAYEGETGYTTTGLVSAAPPSQALVGPLVSLSSAVFRPNRFT